MGVHGLWQLLQPLGYPVSLDSLENKILAVDVSIWLNQAIKGFRDREGRSLQNSHLLGLFHRICKLLFYRIKPVFVFDGGVPVLKKQTLASRRQRKESAAKKSQKISQRLLLNIMNRQAVKHILTGKSEGISTEEAVSGTSSNADIFELPPLPQTSEDSSQEILEEDESKEVFSFIPEQFQDLNNVDINSIEFQSLPPDIQHEILSELKSIQKSNSWANLDEMPKESQCFSDFQMARLLNRRSLQKCLEDVRVKLNSSASQDLAMEYFGTDYAKNANAESRRIVSEDSTHYILIKNKSANLPTATSSPNNDVLSTFSSTSQIVEYDDNTEKKNLKSEEKGNLSSTYSELPSLVEDECNANKIQDYENNFFSDEVLEVQSESGDELSESNKVNIELSSHLTELENQDILKQPENQDLNQEKDKQSLETTVCIELEKTCSSLITTKTEFIREENQVEEITNESNKEAALFQRTDSVHYPSNLQKSDEGSTSDDSFEEVPEIDMEEFSRNLLNKRKQRIIIDDSTDVVEQTESIAEISQSPNEVSSFENKLSESPLKSRINVELLEKLDESFQVEQQMLIKEKSTQERIALSVTDQMYIESQELLRLFGIPFVVSPMEAEAQCAILEQLRLTEGTITDDSDIWLFGGQFVYKNFFNNNKSVELFKNSDLIKELGLDRLKLICIALMTGSDYTDGIEGVGYVTALEILSEFGGKNLESLKEFKNWWCEAQKQHKIPNETKIKKKLRQLSVHDGFPNEAVIDAYLHPTVDDSDEKFSWQIPDLDALREFTYSKFGWTKDKADGIILPVIKKLNLKKSQTHIDSYFQHTICNNVKLQPSKRVKRALKKMTSVSVSEEETPKKKAARSYVKSRKSNELKKNINISESSSEEES